ncbi:hypothetical protein V8C35DRAFT_282366 [Trichoderma chlorosporum]
MKSQILLPLLAFFGATSASVSQPRFQSKDMENIKRALAPRDGTETLYLVNHQEGALTFSGMVNGEEPPSDSDICNLTTSGFVTWEGTTLECTFSSGVIASSTIQDGTHATFSQSGTATNGFRGFTCFRDNNRLLYAAFAGEGGSDDVFSIYFCI